MVLRFKPGMSDLLLLNLQRWFLFLGDRTHLRGALLKSVNLMHFYWADDYADHSHIGKVEKTIKNVQQAISISDFFHN